MVRKKITEAQATPTQNIFHFYSDGTADHIFVSALNAKEAVEYLTNSADMADYVSSYVQDVEQTEEGYRNYWLTCLEGRADRELQTLWPQLLEGFGYTTEQAQ